MSGNTNQVLALAGGVGGAKLAAGLQQLKGSDLIVLVNTADGYAPRPEYRPQTKFEARGLRLGHGVRDLVFRRSS